MSIRDEIIQLIDQENSLSVPITEDTNLYQDLHFDSLSFVCLLVDLEERYNITIALSEMTDCLIVGQLATLVETNVRERNQND